MARAKYKLGKFVKVQESDEHAPAYGAIEEVHQTSDSFKYRVTDIEDTVEEGNIVASFTEQKPRESKPRASKRSKKNTQAQAAA